MTKEEKKVLRGDLFRHLDGIVTAPIAFALHKSGVLDYLLKEERVRLNQVSKYFNANEGYLNIALHTLAAQGWLRYEIMEDETIWLSLTSQSSIAFKAVPVYKDVVDLMILSGQYHHRKFELKPFLLLEQIVERYRSDYGLEMEGTEEMVTIHKQILKHIEGIIVGPTVVAFGMSGMFHKYFMEASFHPGEFHADGESFGRLLDIFVFLGFFERNNGHYRFTEKGLFFARRASAYGVTVSYIPMFRKMDELLFGDPAIFWKGLPGEKEEHVDREMNVWGSGGAHAAYFKALDKIIIDLFNQPIEKQPKGIVDMGCGNGAFLIHLYEVIEQRTMRGELLEEHPLFLIGADFNDAALKVSRSNIVQADIWAKLIKGDIGRPDLLAKDLDENFGIDLKDLLNVRTFLDHNRVWEDVEVSPDRQSQSKGAFAFRGRRLSNAQVEENLKKHLKNWAPYVQNFGLLIIELHTIAPDLIAQHLGRTAATAYNATHGFSDQFILEIETFNKVAREAGLHPQEEHFVKYPNSELATVSINLLKAEK